MLHNLQRFVFGVAMVGILVLVLPKEQQPVLRFVLGLASSSSSSSSSSGNNKRSSPKHVQSQTKGRGFSKINVDRDSQNEEEERNKAKQTVRNLFSVTSHIQNPELYTPPWTQACHFTTTNDGDYGRSSSSPSSSRIIVSSENVSKGTILTAFPIHALGLRFLNNRSSEKDTEFIAYDADRDGEYFLPENPKPGLRMKLNIPLDANQPAATSIFRKDGDRKRFVLFAMTFRNDDDIVPGWLGHRVKSSSSLSSISSGVISSSPDDDKNNDNDNDNDAQKTKANCVMIPLPGAAPLCVVVATRDLFQGEELFQVINPQTKIVQECKELVTTTYHTELSELQEYIRMACEA